MERARKKYILIFAFICFILLSPVSSYAQSCTYPSFNSESWNTMVETLQTTFPFSIVYFSISLLDQMSGISAVSPSEFVFPLGFGVEIPLFEWMDYSGMDTLFLVLRLLMLSGAVFGISKYIMERIL